MLVRTNGAPAPAAKAAVQDPTGSPWWWISRQEGGRTEALTVPCEGRPALALFGHEEDARLFLGSSEDGVFGDGDWRVGEGRPGEIASLLLRSRVATVALDPPPGADSDGTAALVSMDRRAFFGVFSSRDVTAGSPS